MRPRVSVIVVAFRSGSALTRCLDALGNTWDAEVVVVDNGGGGVELEDAARRPGVRVVSPGCNLGFAGGANAGARAARGETLVFLNPDTVPTPGAIDALAGALEDPTVGIATARIRLLHDPARLNSAGNVVHVAGLGWAGMYGEDAEDACELVDVPFPSGAAMAVKAAVLADLGGFTEELFLYQEDLDLGWRARLRGLRVVMTPGADVLHDYEYGRHAQKNYFLERNRLVFVAASFSPRLLALLSPVLVATELGMVALALREGWLRDKAAGWGWCLRNARWLAQHRRDVQGLRRVSDRDLARFLRPVVDPAMIAVPALVRAANPLVAAYWSLARKAL